VGEDISEQAGAIISESASLSRVKSPDESRFWAKSS
jgi:hypothetical protein